MRRLFFHEESIHEVSRRYLEHEYVRTYGQAETNMPPPPHFFKVGAITKLLQLVLLPCYRIMNSGTFPKRSGPATKGFESCEFWFQVAFFNLNTALYFLEYVCMEENNRKISLALCIRLEFNNCIPN